MYTPPAFREDDPEVLATIMAAHPLATLVSSNAGELVATHLPLLHLPDRGLLLGHVSRANTQWHDLDGQQALAIFLGAEGYVTPSWYAAKKEHGKVVPTWNYEAVHVYGQVRLIHDPQRLNDLVGRLTDWRETGRQEPWAVSDAPADFVAAQLKGIVGLTITVERIEGKRKLSQNRPQADRRGVVEGLRREHRADADALAGAMVKLEND